MGSGNLASVVNVVLSGGASFVSAEESVVRVDVSVMLVSPRADVRACTCLDSICVQDNMQYASAESIAKFGTPSFVVNGRAAASSVVAAVDAGSATTVSYDVKLSASAAARAGRALELRCEVHRGWTASVSKFLKKRSSSAPGGSSLSTALMRTIAAVSTFPMSAGEVYAVQLLRTDGSAIVSGEDMVVDGSDAIFMPECELRPLDASGNAVSLPSNAPFILTVALLDASGAPEALLDDGAGGAVSTVGRPLRGGGQPGGADGLRVAGIMFAAAARRVARQGPRRVELSVRRSDVEVWAFVRRLCVCVCVFVR